MANDVSIKFGVEGEQNFKTALAGINSEIKNLDSQFKLCITEMGNLDDAEKNQASQLTILGRQYDANASKLNLLQVKYDTAKVRLSELEKELSKTKDSFGENSKEALKAEDAFNRQARTVNDLGTQINKTSAEMNTIKKRMEDVSSSAGEMSDSMQDSGSKASSFGDILKGTLASGVILEGAKMLASTIKNVGEALFNLGVDAAKYADDMATLSTIVGISYQTLQEFEYMSDLIDTDISTISGSLKKLVRNMDSAREGTGDAADAFSALGISILDDDGALRDAETVFYEIIDALGQMNNETEKDALAMAIFGKSALDLNPMIAAGSETMRQFAQDAHDMGYITSDEAVSASLELADSMAVMKNQVDAVKRNIGIEMLPVLQTLYGNMTDIANEINWDEVAKVATGAAEVIRIAILILIDVIRGAYTMITGVDDAVRILAGSFKELFAGILSIPASAYQWGKDLIQNFIDGIKSKFKALKDAVTSVAQGIKDIIGFSEPKTGPLSNFHTYAPDMMELFAKGVYENMPVVTRALNQIKPSDLKAVGSGIGAMSNVVAKNSNAPIELKLNIDGKQFARAIYSGASSENLRRGGNLVTT